MGLKGLLGKRAEAVAGIDVGVSSVKIVVMEKEKRPVLSFAAVIPHSERPGSVVEIVDSPSFARVMEAVWRHLPERVDRVSFVMPGRLVMMKVFDVPSGTVNVRGFVEEELKKEVPFPLEELVYDMFVYPGRDERKAVVFMVQKSVFERCRRVLLNLGARDAVVDTAFAAMANLISCCCGREVAEETVVGVDIGDSNVNVVVMVEGELAFGQCISEVNGTVILEKIAEAEGLSPEKVREAVVSGRVSEAALEEGAKQFCSALASELITVGARLGGLVVDSVYITGGAVLNPYICKWLREFTAVNRVEIVDPLKGIRVSNRVDKVFLAEKAGELAIAIGGALSLVV